MFLRAVCAFSLCLALSMSAPKSRAQSRLRKPLRISATIDNVKYVYATAPPVAHLKPTNILDANSLDCFGNAIKKPGDTMALVKGDNPLTGPFYIDGAEPGDTLVVKVLDLKVDGDQGVGELGAYFGALNGTKYTAMLHPALPEKIWFYPIDHANNTATFQALDSSFKVKIPLHPFLGCIGVAPAAGEARSSIVPGGVRRQHGCFGSFGGQHDLFSGERRGRAALFRRRARGDG